MICVHVSIHTDTDFNSTCQHFTMLYITDRTDQLKDEEFIQDAQVCVMEARKNLYTKGSEEEGMYHSI